MMLAPGPFAIAERIASLTARLSSVTPSAFAPKSRTLSALLWRDVAVDGTGDAVAVGVASCDWQATSARPAAPPARRTRRRVHARLTVREPRRRLARPHRRRWPAASRAARAPRPRASRAPAAVAPRSRWR